MKIVNLIFLLLLSIACIYMLYLGFSINNEYSGKLSSKSLVIQEHNLTKVSTSPNSYKFDNPILAFRLLKSLKINEAKDYTQLSPSTLRLQVEWDNEYCDNSLKRFIDHPQVIFKQRNIFSDYGYETLLRLTLNKIAHDAQPRVQYYRPKSRQNLFSLKEDINMYYHNAFFHKYMPMGQSVACSHQLYNRMVNLSLLANKGKVAQSYENYLDKYIDKPHCVDRVLPKSYMLWNPNECVAFFDYLETEEYSEQRKKGVVFIQKDVAKHMGTGVYLFDDKHEHKLRRSYRNGRRCAARFDQKIQMQTYIHNPLLLYGHKFDFRVYMLVASVNPLIVYFHDGILRVSLQKFSLDSTKKTTHFTNTHLAEDLFKYAKRHGTWDGMTEAELRDFQTWNFTRLQNYLLEIKKINDTNWLDNDLRHQMRASLAHLLRATGNAFVKRSNIFELWGMDFMMDDNLKLWFIEANAKPGIKAASPMRKRFNEALISNMFNLMFGHLRSRMKRVVFYINDLIKRIPEQDFLMEGIKIPNLEREIEIFETQINVNFMDPEYKPKKTSFYTVIDESLKDGDIYGGLIKKECL